MRGIDVSHHQGQIDWAKVKAEAGIGFVIMKAMFENGHTVESAFERNYKGAEGLQRGVYLYAIARTVEGAKQEAIDLIKILGGRKLEYGVWLDLEDGKLGKLSKKQLTEQIDAQAAIIKGAGYKVGIYSNKNWYNNIIDGVGLARRYDFWIARYPFGDNGTIKESLAPRGWAEVWQYSSKGKVPGIKGNCDLDIEMKDLDQPKPAANGNPYQEPTHNIRLGGYGNEVRWLQYELNWRGFSLVIDGIFGTNTDRCLRAFQDQAHLICDGICGPKTRAALRS